MHINNTTVGDLQGIQLDQADQVLPVTGKQTYVTDDGVL